MTKPSPTLDGARPGATEDAEALRRLTHEYARAVDSGRLDDLVALWTEDAVWDVTAFDMAPVQGVDAIRAFFAALVENTTHRCHLASNHVIDVDGDRASARVYLHAFVVTADGSRDESLGYYDDEYVRTADGWRFQRRTVQPLLPPPPAPV